MVYVATIHLKCKTWEELFFIQVKYQKSQLLLAILVHSLIIWSSYCWNSLLKSHYWSFNLWLVIQKSRKTFWKQANAIGTIRQSISLYFIERNLFYSSKGRGSDSKIKIRKIFFLSSSYFAVLMVIVVGRFYTQSNKNRFMPTKVCNFEN